MDAMIPPDIKPDIKPDVPPDVKPNIKPDVKNSKCTNTEEESFITHVARRSKQILIDDYQSAKTKGNPKLIVAPDLTLPTPRRKYRTKQTKDNTSTINTTSVIAEPMGETRNSKDGLTPDKVTQTVDEDNIEHRKRKHNVGTNQNLVRWLWEDPRRLAKAREDITRWSEYMANEMSNPAFEIFINMASNLSNNKEHSTKTQDG